MTTNVLLGSAAGSVPGPLYRCINRGTTDDWQAFLGRYDVRVRRIVRSAMRQGGVRALPEDIDDLVQDFYCRLFSARCARRPGTARRVSGRTEAEIWCYLAQVARAVAVDHLRARGAAKRPTPESGRSSARVLGTLPSVQASAEERLLAAERVIGLVRRCRLHLGEEAAAGVRTRAVTLALVGGLSSADVARNSHGRLSRAQVDNLVSRVRRRLAGEGVSLARRGAA